jgi:hypothetical protein
VQQNNLVTSIIRTLVTIILPPLVAWLAARGINLSDETLAQISVYAVVAAQAGYYIVVRLLETKYPAFGWLLGLAKQPGYNPDPPAPAPAPDEPPAPDAGP